MGCILYKRYSLSTFGYPPRQSLYTPKSLILTMSEKEEDLDEYISNRIEMLRELREESESDLEKAQYKTAMKELAKVQYGKDISEELKEIDRKIMSGMQDDVSSELSKTWTKAEEELLKLKELS